MTVDLRHAPRARSGLSRWNPGTDHGFLEPPTNRINNGEDLAFFEESIAYSDLMTFLLQLNRAMMPRRSSEEGTAARAWPNDSLHVLFSPQVMKIKVLIQTIASMTKEAPPESVPMRFGNVAFRTWYSLLKQKLPGLMRQAMPEAIWDNARDKAQRDVLQEELSEYLIGSFGSPERLDYGTGHELSFLAFIACIWRLNGFSPSTDGSEERGIVIGIMEPYFELVRHLIKTYNLEPAGSHGVWGLDDHSFLPYVFGSAQLAPPITPDQEEFRSDGSLHGAPKPAGAAEKLEVARMSGKNLYFGALAFIYAVKSGPFWEHSSTLFNISGLDGWAKINKGMVKMFNAEVLSKFPVIQHFPFGTLFRWERDPEAVSQPPSLHMKSQPGQAPLNLSSSNIGSAGTRMPAPTGLGTMLPPGSMMQHPSRSPGMTGTASHARLPPLRHVRSTNMTTTSTTPLQQPNGQHTLAERTRDPGQARR